MKVEVRVPQMGESVSQALIASLLKKEGQYVKQDEELLELETDKTNQILYSPVSGTLHFNVTEGQKVSINELVAEIQEIEEQKEAPTKYVSEVIKNESPEKKIIPPNALSNQYIRPLSENIENKISQKISDEKVTRRKLSTIRQIIAKRVMDAQKNAALLTTFNEIDLSYVQDVREKHKDLFEKVHNVRLGLMSFFVKATVEALKQYPMINSFIDGDDIVTRNTYDIGIAVGTEKGVIVPVIKGADQLSFAQIEQQIVHYAQLAKEGHIKVEDLHGAGFTITNGGVYGSLLSTPILMPSQSGILGLHKIEKRAVVIDDQILIRPMMYVALTYDHRIVDGKEAIGFLVKIKNELEDLSRLLLEL